MFTNLYITLSNHDSKRSWLFLSSTILRATYLVKLFNASTEKSTDETYRVCKSSEAGMDFKIAMAISLSGVRRLKIISGEHGNQFFLVSSAAQAALY